MSKLIALGMVKETIATHQAAVTSHTDYAKNVIRAGELLEKQKAALGHGEWVPFVEQHYPFSRRTASAYMKSFREYGHLSNEKLDSHLSQHGGYLTGLQRAEKEALPPPEWTESEKERRARVETGMTVVANKRTDKALIAWAESNGCLIAIDRTSPWGNPFVVGKDADRGEACEKFKGYLAQKPSLIDALPTLKGKVLACWCHPEPCHGDYLADLAMSGKTPTEPTPPKQDAGRNAKSRDAGGGPDQTESTANQGGGSQPSGRATDASPVLQTTSGGERGAADAAGTTGVVSGEAQENRGSSAVSDSTVPATGGQSPRSATQAASPPAESQDGAPAPDTDPTGSSSPGASPPPSHTPGAGGVGDMAAEMCANFPASVVQKACWDCWTDSERATVAILVREWSGDEPAKPAKRGRFQPPTVADVAAFSVAHNYPIDASEFVDYYAAQGWKLSNGNAMKDWEAAARRWAKQHEKNGSPAKRESASELMARAKREKEEREASR